jgi:hypothetical protein
MIRLLASGYAVLSDDLACFRAVSESGYVHQAVVAGGRRPDELPEFRWINTVLSNLKTSLSGAYHAFKTKTCTPSSNWGPSAIASTGALTWPA